MTTTSETIVGSARTLMAALQWSLGGTKASVLGAAAIRAAVRRAGSPAIDQVLDSRPDPTWVGRSYAGDRCQSPPMPGVFDRTHAAQLNLTPSEKSELARLLVKA